MKSEERIQQECYRWFNNEFPELRGLLFHVPNGGARNGREAAKLKTMGVYPGVSDFLFLMNGTCFCIELKTETGSQSDSQIEWEETVKNQGFSYEVVKSLDEFQSVIWEIIKWYG